MKAVYQELAKAAGVSEADAAKVLAKLGLDERAADALRGVGAQAFENMKLGDLRISAKLGHLLVAR